MARSRDRGTLTTAPLVLAWLPMLLALLTLPASTAHAQPKSTEGSIRVHVRGRAIVKATATSEPTGTVLRGELLDDTGAAMSGTSLQLRAVSATTGASLPLPTPAPCDGARRSARRAIRAVEADEFIIDTDERGAFCVRITSMPDGAKLKLRFEGDLLHSGTESVVGSDTVEQALARTVVRFEPPPEAIDLDRETASLVASLRIDRSGMPPSATGTARREGLTISLEDERGEKIGRALTGGDGRARFEIKTASLAGPGAGELRLLFEGNAALAKANASQSIVRRAEVHLSLSHPVDTGDPEDGVAIEVDVTTSRGAVSGGVVEAMRGNESVGAGTVEGGKANVVASFPFERAGLVPLTLRYVPSAPYFRAGDALPIEVRVAGPGITRQVLIALFVLAVTTWIVIGWRRAPLPKLDANDDAIPSLPRGRAGVDVVRAPSGQTGWRGTVIDAHDGTPIANATLTMIAPAFQGDGVVTRVVANERGQFTIDAPYRSDARLVIEAATHSRHEQALPPPCVLRVALVTRRRSLLERLVRWARRTGAPFDVQPEPTPGHVRRAAFRANSVEVEEWARAVEHAVYGPTPVDEQLEAKLTSDEPRPNRKQDA